MDKTKNAYNELIKGIQYYIEQMSQNGDKTYTAIIKGVGTTEGYKVLLNNIIYDNVLTIGGSCLINETVKVLVPQNNFNNMFILKGGSNGGGGTGGAVSSVNGKDGDVLLTYRDVNALPDTTKIPTKTSELTNNSNFISDINYIHTDNNYTTNDKNKLAGIENNANNYSLPIAGNTLGGVKNGGNVIISNDGTMNVENIQTDFELKLNSDGSLTLYYNGD